MTLIADISSFLGSVWFACLLGVIGYVAGNVMPIGSLFKKNWTQASPPTQRPRLLKGVGVVVS